MSTGVKYIYKILPSSPPDPLPQTLPLSDLDTSSGFIHLSTATQTPKTASLFFASASELWILKLDVSEFEPGKGKGKGKIVWEDVPGHGVFPHLYDGELGRDCVRDVLVFRRREGEGWEGVLGNLEG